MICLKPSRLVVFPVRLSYTLNANGSEIWSNKPSEKTILFQSPFNLLSSSRSHFESISLNLVLYYHISADFYLSVVKPASPWVKLPLLRQMQHKFSFWINLMQICCSVPTRRVSSPLPPRLFTFYSLNGVQLSTPDNDFTISNKRHDLWPLYYHWTIMAHDC